MEPIINRTAVLQFADAAILLEKGPEGWKITYANDDLVALTGFTQELIGTDGSFLFERSAAEEHGQSCTAVEESIIEADRMPGQSRTDKETELRGASINAGEYASVTRWIEMLEIAAGGKPLSGHFRLQRKDGSVFIGKVRARPFQNMLPGVNGLSVLCQIVDETDLLEENRWLKIELEVSRQISSVYPTELETLLNTVLNSLCSAANFRSGQILRVANSLETPADLSGIVFANTFSTCDNAPDGVVVGPSSVVLPILTGEDEKHVLVFELARPELRPELASSNLRRITEEIESSVRRILQRSCISGDVESFAKTRERLLLAVSGSADGLWWWKVDSNESWYSDRFCELLSYSQDELPAEHSAWVNILHPDDRERTLAALEDHRLNGTPYIIEYRLKTGNSGYRWFESRGKTIRDEHGQAIMAGSIRDVTARRLAESELEQTRDKAVQAARVKNEFIANISHELRTPLNGVIGMTNMLLLSEMTVEQAHYVHTIQEAAQSLTTVFSDLLDLSTLETGQLRLESIEFDPAAVIESVAQLLSPLANSKGIVMLINISDSLPKLIRTDQERLRQILFNLTSNAVKFTERGYVCINARLKEIRPDQSEQQSCDPDTSIIEIEVVDTGVGICPQDIGKLFQDFVQLDSSPRRRHGGTGLGLAISQRVAGIMGGVIQASSIKGKGSNFRLSLPVRCTDPQLVNDELQDKCILVVHPHAASGESLCSIVKSLGARVVRAFECEELIGLDFRQFDSVLIPQSYCVEEEMRGYVENISRTAPHCKMVLIKQIASPSAPDYRDECAIDGIVGTLTLPFRRSQLLSVLAMGPFQLRRPLSSRDRPTILVAEDHPVNQEIAGLYLRELGFDCQIVPDGNCAVNAVAEAKEPFGLILMDCQMPGVDGYEASKLIRDWERKTAQTRRIPIVAMTAHILEGDKEQCRAVGMDDYVCKPLYLDSLQEVLGKWIPDISVEANLIGLDSQFQNYRKKQTLSISQPKESIDLSTGVHRYGAARLVKLFDMFLEDALPRRLLIKTAIEQKDATKVAALTHGLAGASATIFATRMKSICSNMDAAARERRWETVTHTFDLLEGEIDQLRSCAARFKREAGVLDS